MSASSSSSSPRPIGDTRVQLADGTTIIPSTRRPDGTWRKEVRVRPGFVPLEEAGAYKSPAQRAAEARNGLPVGAGPEFLETPEARVRGRGAVHAPVPGQLLRAIQQAADSHGAGALPPVRPGAGSVQTNGSLAPSGSLAGTHVDTTGLTASQKRSVLRGEKRRQQREEAAADRLQQRMAEVEAAVAAKGQGQASAAAAQPGTVSVTSRVVASSSGAAPAAGSAPAAATPEESELAAATKALRKAQKLLRQTLDLEASAAVGDKPLNAEQSAKVARKWELVAQVEELTTKVTRLGGEAEDDGEGYVAPGKRRTGDES